MSNKETILQQNIRLALGTKSNLRLFRNETGKLPDPRTGQWVQFGLAKGSSDLIGFKTIKVTPEMIGQDLAVFTSIEVKTNSGQLSKYQHNWLHGLPFKVRFRKSKLYISALLPLILSAMVGVLSG